MSSRRPIELGQSVKSPDIKDLREAIPEHCFKPSLALSLSYVARDVVIISALAYAALSIPSLASVPLRVLLWTLYGFTQGLFFTGIWILAHECGHGAFSQHRKVNSVVGFFLHTAVLVPFFSWKFSHSRHHRYANNMEKDTVFVPTRKEQHRSSPEKESFWSHGEDSPIVTIGIFLGHQLLGWPAYILFNAGAGPNSLVKSKRGQSLRQSHLDPTGDVFTMSEHPFVLLSDLGLAAVLGPLYFCSLSIGAWNTFFLYGIPYLWMNHWLVAITYLHHTHPDTPHYENDAWTFQKGALSTIDRDFGFIGRHIFHGIIEYHVVHHLFARIPFYHAEEATKAIQPLLGDQYKRQDTSFLQDLWQTFQTCQYVEPDASKAGVMNWAPPKLSH